MSILPDEILSEILSPALKVSDELFSDTSDVSPFAKPSLSTSAYLVVCRDWLRVATPLLYNVVVLRSKSQANALEKVLAKNTEFGRYIKKLRVEGGYGAAMHTILKSAPHITDIFLSLVIYSSDGTQGLCKGLPLINPRRVILVDPFSSKALKNKHLTALTEVIFSSLKKWDNLRVVDYPEAPSTFARLTDALAQSQVQTVSLPEVWELPDYVYTLANIPSVQVIQFKGELSPGLQQNINANARLKTVVRYPSPSRDTAQGQSDKAPDILPSLDPLFVPMQSASDETRELVWKHILLFAMADAFPLTDIIGLERLALPYMFDCLNLNHSYHMGSLASQLLSRPELGPCIRHILWPHYGSTTDSMLTVFSCATNLQIMSANAEMPRKHLDVLTKTARSSLRELKARFSRDQIPISVLARLQELQVLELSCSSVTFTCVPTLRDGLDKLHTLRIQYIMQDFSLLPALATLSLKSLRTLQSEKYPVVNYEAFWVALTQFLTARGKTLLHLKFKHDPENTPQFKLFDVCRELIDVEFMVRDSEPTASGLYFFECLDLHDAAPIPKQDYHEQTYPRVKTAIQASSLPPNTMMQRSRSFQPEHVSSAPRDPGPLIGLAYNRDCRREISKSTLIPLSEAWLKHGIKMTDGAGQHWIPRVKRSRRR
ncbi:hypothetical protein C8R47DRAFT_1066692 [Mycena vitilis]|nr:hypothetical protein C8R47DRAFT_1066692 [Mycena vitilis]